MQIIRDRDTLAATIPRLMGQRFAFDVETSGLNPREHRLLGISLYTEGGDNLYIALAHTMPDGDGVTVQTFLPIEEVRTHVQPLFDQDVWMVAWNAKFDVRFLRANGLSIRGELFDAMLAAKLVNENHDSYGLKETAWRELNYQMDHYQDLVAYAGFDKHAFLAVPLEPAARYACADTEATWRLALLYRDQLVEEGVAEPFYRIWMPLLTVLSEMEDAGIALDLTEVRAYRDDCARRAADLEFAVWREGIEMVLGQYEDQGEIDPRFLKIARHLDPDFLDEGQDFHLYRGIELPLVRPTERSAPRLPHFNAGSVQHLGALLYEYYRLRPMQDVTLKVGKTGRSVDKDALEVLKFTYGEDAPKVLDDLLAWRKVNKLITSFLDPYLERADPANHNSIYPTFNQHVAVTGRLSCMGPNLQQVSSRGAEGAKMRSLFVARPGHRLVVADFGNMELRYAGHVSKDANLIKAFTEGLDLHSFSASAGVGESYEDFMARYEAGDKLAKEQRAIYKMVNFCVPLDTLCFTQHGWKRYDEVDPEVHYTLGYNPATERMEWTRITHVYVYEDPTPLISLRSRTSALDWHTISTPNHRWLVREEAHPERVTFKQTIDLAHEDTVVTSAPLDTFAPLDLTDDEARLLAFLICFGPLGRAPDKRHTNEYGTALYISSAYPEDWPIIEAALVDVPHTYSMSSSPFRSPQQQGWWTLSHLYAAALLDKLGIGKLSDIPTMLTRLTHHQREVMIETVENLELFRRNTRKERHILRDTTAETLALLYFLHGRRLRTGRDRLDPDWAPQPLRGYTTLPLPEPQPVWCVTTELGSWTIKQGDTITLSGNSTLYGTAGKTLQRRLLVDSGVHVSRADADGFIAAFHEQYDGLTAWKERVYEWARKLGYVQTFGGRKRRLPGLYSPDRWEVMRAERMAISSIIQGSCADIMNLSLISMQEQLKPIGARVLLAIHDEAVVEAPEEHAEAAKRIMESAMMGVANDRLLIPMEVEAHIGTNWGAAKG